MPSLWVNSIFAMRQTLFVGGGAYQAIRRRRFQTTIYLLYKVFGNIQQQSENTQILSANFMSTKRSRSWFC